MRCLHTADVHLHPDHQERREALEAVLARAETEAVDVVTIGGDLFEDEQSANSLRSELRETFSDRPYDVLTIPGNHDADAFAGNLHFGEHFVPATAEPFEQVTYGDTRITTLPYTAEATEELLVTLQQREPFDGPECLLLHCSLEAPIDTSAGDEAEVRYFPIGQHELAELDFAYYLAGHYHSTNQVALPNGGTFVYPGTPASTTTAETGQRACVLLDTDETPAIQPITLGTFHHDSIDRRVLPGEEERVLETIESQVATWADRNVEARIHVDGYTEWGETEFEESLAAAAGDVEYENASETVEHILTHPLFERFEACLEGREDFVAVRGEWEELEQDIWETALHVMADRAAGGAL